MRMKTQWFVIHTLSGQEQKVKESIEKRLKAEEMGEYIKEVLVPRDMSLSTLPCWTTTTG